MSTYMYLKYTSMLTVDNKSPHLFFRNSINLHVTEGTGQTGSCDDVDNVVNVDHVNWVWGDHGSIVCHRL